MVIGIKDGMKSGQMHAEELSGLAIFVDGSIGTAELATDAVTTIKVTNDAIDENKTKFFIMSGAYEADDGTKWNVYPTDFTFSVAPTVIMGPTEAHGIEAPFAISADIGVGSFQASGAFAHTGAYLAYGR